MADAGTTTTPLIDLDAIIAKSQAALRSAGQGMADVVSGMTAGKKAADLQTQAANETAGATVQINTSKMQAERKEQADNAWIAAKSGYVPGDDNSTIAQLAAAGSSMSKNVLAQIQDVEQRRSVSVFHDPGQWLWNQIVLPAKEADLKQSATDLSIVHDNISKIEDTTTAAFKLNAAIDVNVSEEKLAGVNSLAYAQSKKDIAESLDKMAQLGLQEGSIRMAHSDDEFNMTARVNEMRAQAEQLRLQQANFDYTSLMRDQVIKDRADKKSEEDILQIQLDQVNDSLGNQRFGINTFKMMSNAQRAPYESMIASGTAIVGSAGPTPAKALDNMNATNSQGTPGMNYVRDKLMTVIAPTIREGSYGQLKPEVASTVKNKVIADHVGTELKNIPDQEGIYSPASLAATLSIPMVAETGLAKLMAPLASANKMYATRPTDVVNTAMLAVGAAKSPSEQSVAIDQMTADIVKMYTGIANDTNSQRQFQRYAMPRLAAGTTGYNVSVDNPGIWGKSHVNMLDPAAVKNLLTRRWIGQTISKTQGTFGMGN